MRTIPSLKALRAHERELLGNSAPPGATPEALRAVLVQWCDREITTQDTLAQLDVLMGTHGVEYLESENGRARVYYCNAGDAYALTLLLDLTSMNVRLTCWGDWVEKQERRGNRFT